jgi:hypothetical protein
MPQKDENPQISDLVQFPMHRSKSLTEGENDTIRANFRGVSPVKSDMNSGFQRFLIDFSKVRLAMSLMPEPIFDQRPPLHWKIYQNEVLVEHRGNYLKALTEGRLRLKKDDELFSVQFPMHSKSLTEGRLRLTVSEQISDEISKALDDQRSAMSEQISDEISKALDDEIEKQVSRQDQRQSRRYCRSPKKFLDWPGQSYFFRRRDLPPSAPNFQRLVRLMWQIRPRRLYRSKYPMRFSRRSMMKSKSV